MPPLLSAHFTVDLVPKPGADSHATVNFVTEVTSKIISVAQHGALIAQVAVVLLLIKIFLKGRVQIEERVGQAYHAHHPPTLIMVPSRAISRDLISIQLEPRLTGISDAHIKRAALSLLYSWPLGSLTRLSVSLWRLR